MKKNNKEMLKIVKIFGVGYELKIGYKYMKNPKLEVKNKEIEIYLPNKYKKIDNTVIIELLLDKMYEAIANKEIDYMMEKVRTTLKFAPEDYKIMKLDKRLGRCFANRIIINPEIVKYRKEIIEYIIFCEFCNIKVKRHSKKFQEMLKKYIPNYEYYEYELIGTQY